jgi:hypothetical protein
MIFGMVVYGVWYSVAGSDRSAIQVIQQVPDRLVTLVNSDKADTTEHAAAATAPDAVPPAETAAPVSAGEGVTPDNAEGESKTAEVLPSAPPSADTQPADVVELRAKSDLWVTLRDAQKADHTQFLRKGEVFRVQDARATTLLTATASDLEVLINGKVASLGDAGVFAKGVALDPAHLKAAPAAAPAAPQSSN